MTVSSLWKALDRAGCGKPVGVKELQEHSTFHERTNPWNINDKRDSNNRHCPTLAVDLSIWICEALTCSAFEKSKTDPSLHLVYTRTVKLLSLGFKLVMVVEGKRRTRHHDGLEDSFRKRRSGTFFWNSCQRCEQMLRLLGVPVVRAKAEGEALCALLNHKGIVDGVISNDGDCFLFGAKVLYTKFTLENLEKKMVMRYDISDIRACVDDDDGNEYDNEREPREIVSLDRSDLIAFAMLTGSDAVGAGLPKVGCRKAIRFIKKCQLDNPLKRQDAAMNELKSWSRAVATTKTNPINNCNHEESQVKAKQTYSCCGHPGTKAIHQKHGCKLCGTEPGESCFALSPGAKFRSAMRKKAMAMEVDFDPESVIKVYQNPNDNQIPLPLLGKTSMSLQMAYPNFQGFQDFPMVIRGQNLVESRKFLQQSLSSLMARNELLNSSMCENTESTASRKLPSNKTRPEPRVINKTMVRGGKPSFEVEWIVKATVTDAEGNPMDEFVFCTIEDQQMVKRRYPKLIEEFETQEKERAKQGDAEQEKRRAFLELLCAGCDPKEDTKRKTEARKVAGRCFREDRRASFEVSEATEPGKDDEHKDPTDMEISFVKHHGDAKKKSTAKEKLERKQEIWGDDADKLLRFVGVNANKTIKNDGCTSICTDIDSIATMDEKEPDPQYSKRPSSLTPGHLHYLGSNRTVKFPNEDPILHPQDGGTSFKENHQPKDSQPSLPPPQPTTCLKECCTNNKECTRNSYMGDESSAVLHKHKHKSHVLIRKPAKPWFLGARKSNVEKQQNGVSHIRPARYPQDDELSTKRALFQADPQQMNHEPLDRNQHFYFEDIEDTCANRAGKLWKSHRRDSITIRKPRFPCSDDSLLKSPHRFKILRPQEEEYEDLVPPNYESFSVTQLCDIPLDSNPRLEVGYTGPKQRYRGQRFSERPDVSARKRRKIEFELWDDNYKRFLPAAETCDIHDVHHLQEEKVSRTIHWEESNYTRAPRYPRNDDFFNLSYHREEEKDDLDHSNMRAYPEFRSFDKMLNLGQSDSENLSHSNKSFIQLQWFQDISVKEFSHGKNECCWTPSALSSNVANHSKVADGRLLEDAVAEKLRIKISQAALDEECCRQLEEKSW